MAKKVIALIFLAILGITSYFLLKDTLYGRVFLFGVNINASGLKLNDSYSEKSGTNTTEWVVASSPTIILFIGKSKPENASKFINDKIFTLEALFEPTTSPYPEVVTNVINCSDEFKPVDLSFPSGKVFKLYAGERYGYGICSKDLIKFDSLYGIFDCGVKGVVQIKIFGSGADSIQKIMESFSCGRSIAN